MSSNWNATLPADTSKMKISASLIRNNFSSIDTGVTGTGYGFTRNHVTMTDGTNGGLHYRVDFYQAVSSPTLSGVASLYPRTVTNVELFHKNAQADIQVTNSLLTASSGEGMTPGGLQIRCGSGTTGASNNVSFTPQFPTACISVVATALDTGNQVNVVSSSISPTACTVFSVSSGTNFRWIAIGY